MDALLRIAEASEDVPSMVQNIYGAIGKVMTPERLQFLAMK